MNEWSIVWMDLKKMMKSSKFYLLLFFLWFFMSDYALTLKNMAAAEKLAVAPFLYPVFMGEWSYRLFGILAIIMLLAQVPFKDDSQLYVVHRMGRQRWMNAKILFVFVISVIYQICAVIISALVLLPHLGIANDWGEIIKGVAFERSQAMASTGNVAAMESIVDNFQPLQALMLTLLLTVLISSMAGLFIFITNEVTKSSLGTILTLIISCADLFFSALREFGFGLPVPLLMSWMDLSQVYTKEYVYGKNSLTMELVVLVAINVGLIIVLKKAVKVRAIEVVE